MKWSDKFLVIYLVSLSLFRIDFGMQKAGIVITPALCLSLLLIAAAPFILFSGRAKVNVNLGYYFAFLSFILLWCIVTVVPYYDFLQIKRLVLFGIIIISTIIFLIIFSRSEYKIEIINQFSKAFLWIYFIFCVIDIYLYNYQFHKSFFQENIPFFTVHFSYISYFLIRMKGPFIDSNIAGYFLIFLYILHCHLNLSKIRRWVFIVLVLLTFSRSSIGTLVIVLFLQAMIIQLEGKSKINIPIRISRKRVKYVFISVASVILFSLLAFNYTALGERLKNAVSTRLSSEDGSTSIHFSLIELGIEKIFANPLSFIKGYGFSSSFIFAESFFPGNKYANFHSEYITIFVETGAIGILLFGSIYLIPLLGILSKPTTYKNILLALAIIAFALENIFYQQYLFHYYWIFFGMIWWFPFTNKTNLSNDVSEAVNS